MLPQLQARMFDNITKDITYLKEWFSINKPIEGIRFHHLKNIHEVVVLALPFEKGLAVNHNSHCRIACLIRQQSY